MCGFNVFISSTKAFVSIAKHKTHSSLVINTFALYTLYPIGPIACRCLQCDIMAVGLEIPPKEHKLRGNHLQNFISSRDGPVKVQKQGREVENMQEDYPTMERWWKRKTRRLTLYLLPGGSRCRVVFLYIKQMYGTYTCTQVYT